MNRNMIETVLGAVVLLAAAVFLGFAYNSADMGKAKEGYVVTAEFDRIDGLKAGSDVRMNGVLVGSVRDIVLDKNTYRAAVHFTVASEIKLPIDTNAQVASEGLLGGKYLSLEVGVEDEMLTTDGKGRLTHTTPPMRLDDLIGQLIYNKPSGGGAGGESKAPGGNAGQIATPSIVPPATVPVQPGEAKLPEVPAKPPQ